MDIMKRIELIEELLKQVTAEIESLKSDLTGSKPTEKFEATLDIKKHLSDISEAFKS